MKNALRSFVLTRGPWMLLIAAGVAAACSDAGDAARTGPHLAAAVSGGSGIVLDQSSGIADDPVPWGQAGETHIGKNFPSNPHPGDAVVATFFWKGSTNTITDVSDHFCDVNSTPIGNTYTLVDYVTAGGYSMATYVAYNVQGFPDSATSSNQLLCVHAIFSNTITEGGMVISAYSGVAASAALGAHQSAVGTASSTVSVGPGAIPVGSGALAYAVTMADGAVGTDPPAGFTDITDVSDDTAKADAEYEVVPGAGTVDPKWNWYFTSPHSWLATDLALNPATRTTNQPPVAAFTSSCSSLSCTFTSTSSDPDGSISAYSWTFGDGGTSAVQNPSHSYGAGGTYTVTLTVTDNQGATNSVSHSVTVTAPNQAPVVNAGADQTVLLGVLYTLNATFSDPDNGPWTYTINWGDGSSSSGSKSSTGTISAGHTYLGLLTQRTIRVTVTDSQGASGSSSKVITLIL